MGGDEATLREFPPLRAAWSRRGEQARVVLSGRNARRVLVGFLNVATGGLVRAVRGRGRGEDIAEGIGELGEPAPGVPRLLVLDNAPPHKTRVAREASERLGIEVLYPPFRSPEPGTPRVPIEDLWRELKRVVAANRVYDSVDDLAGRATGSLDELSPEDVLRISGLNSSKFDWLPT